MQASYQDRKVPLRAVLPRQSVTHSCDAKHDSK